MKVRLEIQLSDEQVAFLKEEAARRSKSNADQGYYSPWTWREVAWVKAQIALHDWIDEQRAERARKQEAVA